MKGAQKDHKNTMGKELPTNYGDLGPSLEPKISSLKHTETCSVLEAAHTDYSVHSW